MTLVLAVWPPETTVAGLAQDGCCTQCRCCVEANSNPSPLRPAPVPTVRVSSVERAVEPSPDLAPVSFNEVWRYFQVRASVTSQPLSGPLFERFCILLI